MRQKHTDTVRVYISVSVLTQTCYAINLDVIFTQLLIIINYIFLIFPVLDYLYTVLSCNSEL